MSPANGIIPAMSHPYIHTGNVFPAGEPGQSDHYFTAVYSLHEGQFFETYVNDPNMMQNPAYLGEFIRKEGVHYVFFKNENEIYFHLVEGIVLIRIPNPEYQG